MLRRFLPPEFQQMDKPCARITKALYGLPASGFDFDEFKHRAFLSDDWKPLLDFSSLYTKILPSGEQLYLGVYVDDLYMIGSKSGCKTAFESLKKHFSFGEVLIDAKRSKFVGIHREFHDDHTIDHMIPYLRTLIDEYKSVCDINGPLRSHFIPFSTESANTPDALEVSEMLQSNPAYDPHHFVAALLFVARCVRPDISFAVSFLGRAVSRWSKMHDRALKQLICYLNTTVDLVLKLPARNSFNPSQCYLEVFSDADHAGDLQTSRSTSGFVTYLVDKRDPNRRFLLDWSCKLQEGTALSTPDAELTALQRAVTRSALPLQILIESFFQFEVPLYFHCDNSAGISAVSNGASAALRYLKKTQRVSIPFLHQVFGTAANQLNYVDTGSNVADLFTKFLSTSQHQLFCGMLNLVSFSSVFGSVFGENALKVLAPFNRGSFRPSHSTDVPYVFDSLEPWSHHGSTSRHKELKQLNILFVKCQLQILKEVVRKYSTP